MVIVIAKAYLMWLSLQKSEWHFRENHKNLTNYQEKLEILNLENTKLQKLIIVVDAQ